MESDVPAGYSAEEARAYFVRNPGSDFMVDMIKRLGLDYIKPLKEGLPAKLAEARAAK